MNINIANFQRGPGYFKLNNSFLLDKEYQEIIKNSITEITLINEDANPNTLWELVKGTIRNESIKYGSKKKKETDKLEKQLTKEIENLNKTINDTLNNSTLDLLKQEIDTKTAELNSLIDKKIDGYILRSKAQVVEEGEKNSKYFASLEKKKAENKIISRLEVKGNIITDQKDILTEEKSYYENLFSKRDRKNSFYNFFDNNITKLNDDEQQTCDGILTERELAMALKNMKNQKSPGSDGLTTEFYKLFWNDIKKLLHRFNKLLVSEWKTDRTSKSKCHISYSEIGKRYIIFRKLASN